MAVSADAGAGTLDFVAAGTGLGYCGAQLRSDGTSIYATGSVDSGATCGAVDTLCVLASDAATATTCSGAVTAFALGAFGRKAATGAHESAASLYPAAPNVTLDGTATDAVHFGPTVPTPGVGALGGK